jgi:hypothetical protein
MLRRCNPALVNDTFKLYEGVQRTLPRPTAAAVHRALRAARAAASRGHCAQMHKHTQAARARLEQRIDALLGRAGRKRRRR